MSLTTITPDSFQSPSWRVAVRTPSLKFWSRIKKRFQSPSRRVAVRTRFYEETGIEHTNVSISFTESSRSNPTYVNGSIKFLAFQSPSRRVAVRTNIEEDFYAFGKFQSPSRRVAVRTHSSLNPVVCSFWVSISFTERCNWNMSIHIATEKFTSFNLLHGEKHCNPTTKSLTSSILRLVPFSFSTSHHVIPSYIEDGKRFVERWIV